MTNASTGFTTRTSSSATFGTGRRITGCSDHQSRPARASFVFSNKSRTRLSGHSAPPTIHWRRPSISAAGSRCDLPCRSGGISPVTIRLISRLCSLCPTTIPCPRITARQNRVPGRQIQSAPGVLCVMAFQTPPREDRCNCAFESLLRGAGRGADNSHKEKYELTGHECRL